MGLAAGAIAGVLVHELSRGAIAGVLVQELAVRGSATARVDIARVLITVAARGSAAARVDGARDRVATTRRYRKFSHRCRCYPKWCELRR